ncbi:MAG: metal-dependent transcriptional regulator [Anaerolineae bacterium]|jgi:DtxR family Mn-dependent transcriptional regulator|nr:metal-dependent transcriptional regulator [Anaerolineae bacterium]
MSVDELSLKMRVYLAEIYRLADRDNSPDGFISTSALSELLDVTAPAVNRMVNRLKEPGLLEHQPYQGIRLTASGRVEALKQIRAHRIAECFLLQVMGIAWEDVYHEAARISGVLNETLIDRMATMAGQPTLCPHGEPIPAADGTLTTPADRLLASVSAGTKVHVSRLRTRDTDRLRYLDALGLLPGATLEILHVAPFNGPMQLKIGGEYRIIGHNLAELIRVQPDDPAAP